MAAPIAHIFVALSLLNSGILQIEDKQAFIIGTSFPDIRYLAEIDRDQTHTKNVTLNDVKNASTSFEKGRLLHCLLDEIREEFITQHKLYDLIPNTQFRTQILKFYEDIHLYNKVNNWPEIVGYFDTVLPEQEAYSIKKIAIKTWHDLLKQYFSEKPRAKHIATFFKQHTLIKLKKENNIFKRLFLRLKAEIINRVVTYKLRKTLNKLEDNEQLKRDLSHFYEHANTFIVEK